MSRFDYDKNPDLFPIGKPKPYTPTPLEALGSGGIEYDFELSGSDLSLVSRTGKKSTITLPSNEAPEVVSFDFNSFTIGVIYDAMENLVINEIKVNLENGDWWNGSGFETELSAYLPDPANLSVGDEITIFDYNEVSLGNNRFILFLEGDGGAYTFDNPNDGNNFLWDGAQDRVRVTGATTYEILP